MFKYIHLPNANSHLKILPLQPVLTGVLNEMFDATLQLWRLSLLDRGIKSFTQLCSYSYPNSCSSNLFHSYYSALLLSAHLLSHLPCWIVRVDTVTMKITCFFFFCFQPWHKFLSFHFFFQLHLLEINPRSHLLEKKIKMFRKDSSAWTFWQEVLWGWIRLVFFSATLTGKKLILTIYFYPLHLFLTFFIIQGEFQVLEFLPLTGNFITLGVLNDKKLGILSSLKR